MMRKISYYIAVLLLFRILSQLPTFFNVNNTICWIVLRLLFWGCAIAIFLLAVFFMKEKILQWWDSLSTRAYWLIISILFLTALAELILEIFKKYP